MTFAMMKPHKPAAIDATLKSLVLHHPAIALVLMFIGAPILMLLAVGLSSTAVILPISLLCGWI